MDADKFFADLEIEMIEGLCHWSSQYELDPRIRQRFASALMPIIRDAFERRVIDNLELLLVERLQNENASTVSSRMRRWALTFEQRTRLIQQVLPTIGDAFNRFQTLRGTDD